MVRGANGVRRRDAAAGQSTWASTLRAGRKPAPPNGRSAPLPDPVPWKLASDPSASGESSANREPSGRRRFAFPRLLTGPTLTGPSRGDGRGSPGGAGVVRASGPCLGRRGRPGAVTHRLHAARRGGGDGADGGGVRQGGEPLRGRARHTAVAGAEAHGGTAEQIKELCMDMSPAYIKGARGVPRRGAGSRRWCGFVRCRQHKRCCN